MKIAINGIGVAGPTLAWWLKKYGHDPVLFEIAPKLRTGGYVIDFWGAGYDIAEKMGILPTLKEKGYFVRELRFLDKGGAQKTSMNMDVMARLINNRFLSIARSDLASTLYHACKGVEARFGTSIVGIKEQKKGVRVQLSDGSQEHFDLVVGADGLHSKVRSLAFGPQKRFERHLGYHVAAFELPHYRPRNELVYIMHRSPQRSAARFSMRDDKTLFMFVFKSDLLKKLPKNEAGEKAAVHQVFDDMKWEVPKILGRMHEVKDIYFDRVSQICMPHWTKGRVALIGDAAACASLLAGEGSGLAMIEAYVLAGELHREQGDYKKAFQAYEQTLHDFLAKKQKSALGFAGFFAPKSQVSLAMSHLAVQLSKLPFVSKFFVAPSLVDDITLSDYLGL